ncbi:hypothetical protein [Arthrobacter sp. HLT1-20]
MIKASSVIITIEDDGPLLVIIFLVIALISIGVQILENARQRRKLAVEAGHNQETRQKGRLFFYTVLVLGLITLVVNYVTGITSSMAAAHVDEVTDPISLLALPGIGFTGLTLGVYAVSIVVIAALFLKNERIELPDLLADLHDARKFGALDSPRQIAHYTAELGQLRHGREDDRAKQFTDGDFDRWFTAHEAQERPRMRQQIRYLRNHPEHRARTTYLHRRLFLNYRLAAGKWLLPLGLLAGSSFIFGAKELMAPGHGGTDYSLVAAWIVAGLLGVAAFAGQYRCDVGKVLLKARKEYVADQTEAECRAILEEATQDLPDPNPRASDTESTRRGLGTPLLSIGPWAIYRRTAKPRPDDDPVPAPES